MYCCWLPILFDMSLLAFSSTSFTLAKSQCPDIIDQFNRIPSSHVNNGERYLLVRDDCNNTFLLLSKRKPFDHSNFCDMEINFEKCDHIPGGPKMNNGKHQLIDCCGKNAIHSTFVIKKSENTHQDNLESKSYKNNVTLYHNNNNPSVEEEDINGRSIDSNNPWNSCFNHSSLNNRKQFVKLSDPDICLEDFQKRHKRRWEIDRRTIDFKNNHRDDKRTLFDYHKNKQRKSPGVDDNVVFNNSQKLRFGESGGIKSDFPVKNQINNNNNDKTITKYVNKDIFEACFNIKNFNNCNKNTNGKEWAGNLSKEGNLFKEGNNRRIGYAENPRRCDEKNYIYHNCNYYNNGWKNGTNNKHQQINGEISGRNKMSLHHNSKKHNPKDGSGDSSNTNSWEELSNVQGDFKKFYDTIKGTYSQGHHCNHPSHGHVQNHKGGHKHSHGSIHRHWRVHTHRLTHLHNTVNTGGKLNRSMLGGMHSKLA